MKNIALQFTSFWYEETFSKKIAAILFFLTAQFFYLVFFSYIGEDDYIFGRLGYEFSHFFISKFLGIATLFFPTAFLYWSYAWFLNKENSGKIVRDLFFLFGFFFSLNLLLLNGLLIETKWAGLFPKFFHAIIYFIFNAQLGSFSILPTLFELGLFLLFTFFLIKNGLNLTFKDTWDRWKLIVKKCIYCVLVISKKTKQFAKLLLNKLKNKNISFPEKLRSIRIDVKNFWKEIVYPLDWKKLHPAQKEKLSDHLIIRIPEKDMFFSPSALSSAFLSTDQNVFIHPQGNDNESNGIDDFNQSDQESEKSNIAFEEQEVIDISNFSFFRIPKLKNIDEIKSLFQDDVPNLQKGLHEKENSDTTSSFSIRGNSNHLEENKENQRSENQKNFRNTLLPSIINFSDENQNKSYWLADENSLLFSNQEKSKESEEVIKANSKKLEDTIQQFGIKTQVVRVSVGPVITQYELMIEPGVKINKIMTLADNISLALAATSVRIVAPIPGKEVIGIEIPNKIRSMVRLRDIVAQEKFKNNQLKLPIALGASISGEPIITDLSLTPHLLVAGATGSGKSVCVNSIILSLLLQKSPLDVRLIMIDPKMVELNIYNGIPHLLAPVITDHKKAAWLLRWAITEMESRYRLLEKYGVRGITSYNETMSSSVTKESHVVSTLPYIVIIIDEFADLMMIAKKEIEDSVSRLAAMSRAVGIHLILATQRPSVDVITGVIKANFPSRIAFQVSSKVDSRTIIDSMGAEKLLGKGDLLYQHVGSGIPERIQGAFLSDEEVKAVVNDLKARGKEDYLPELLNEQGDFDDLDGQDELFKQALEIALNERKISASYLQRKLKVGYNRAARIVEMMEEKNIVGSAEGSKPREVLI